MEEKSLEVFLVSALNDDQASFSLWNLRTGNLIKSYKGGQQQGCNCLARTGRDYVLTSQESKQVISVWEWNKEQMQMKIVCPEKVTAISCSPDGNYCLVALLDKIFIWQLSSGNLMKILSRHYQNVNHLKFTDDGSHFVSAGDDNLVIVWELASVLSTSSSSTSYGPDAKPMHTWSNHTLPVKDVHLTSGGVRCRVATCSFDQTCKLYDMASGVLLCSFLFDTGLTAITMDPAEYFIFVGGINGKIYVLCLSAMKIKKDQIMVNDSVNEPFHGHSKAITKLSVNSNGDTLVSGSADQSVRLWHIKSGQCIKQIEFKGRVTNLEVFRPPEDFANRTSAKIHAPIANFKRNVYEPLFDAPTSDTTENVIPLVLKDIDKEFLTSCDCNYKPDNPEVEEMDLTMKIIAERALAKAEKVEPGPKETNKMDRNELIERIENLESLARTLYAMNANRIINEVSGND